MDHDVSESRTERIIERVAGMPSTPDPAMSSFGEEIHDFESLGEYERFGEYIGGQVAAGLLAVRTPEPDYEKGLIFGGRWYEDPHTNEIWRLVPPDFPFRGLWEKVDLKLQRP
jgi:hypothetical protein